MRWFQYGVFCPICRVHGIRRLRNPAEAPGDPISDPFRPTVPNEVWSYGEEAYAILSEQLLLRERLRPYLMEQMVTAQARGLPPMRPLFVDYPSDANAWEVEDQFLLGPDVLVAPVLEEGARSRRVYLPAGQAWRCAWTDARHEGGTTVAAEAPLSRIPVFIRAESGSGCATAPSRLQAPEERRGLRGSHPARKSRTRRSTSDLSSSPRGSFGLLE